MLEAAMLEDKHASDAKGMSSICLHLFDCYVCIDLLVCLSQLGTLATHQEQWQAAADYYRKQIDLCKQHSLSIEVSLFRLEKNMWLIILLSGHV